MLTGSSRPSSMNAAKLLQSSCFHTYFAYIIILYCIIQCSAVVYQPVNNTNDLTLLTITMTLVMMMVTMIGQSRGEVVYKKCLPNGSISGSGRNDSVFVNADDLYDFRQMCTPEHDLINHTAIIRKLHDVYFTAKKRNIHSNSVHTSRYRPLWLCDSKVREAGATGQYSSELCNLSDLRWTRYIRPRLQLELWLAHSSGDRLLLTVRSETSYDQPVVIIITIIVIITIN